MYLPPGRRKQIKQLNLSLLFCALMVHIPYPSSKATVSFLSVVCVQISHPAVTHVSSCCRYPSPRCASVHAVIRDDFRIMQRNVRVGVGLSARQDGPTDTHFQHPCPPQTFLWITHFPSFLKTAFVLLWSPCCLLPLCFLPCWLFCWRTPAGCGGCDGGGMLGA